MYLGNRFIIYTVRPYWAFKTLSLSRGSIFSLLKLWMFPHIPSLAGAESDPQHESRESISIVVRQGEEKGNRGNFAVGDNK